MPDSSTNDQLAIKCVKCGYDLRGFTRPVCPECGKDYGSPSAMMAECDKTGRNEARVRFAAHCVLLGSGVSNGIGTALVIAHFALGLYLRNPELPDPKMIGLFGLPGIGGTIRLLAILAWIFIPFATLLALGAVVLVFQQRTIRGSEGILVRSEWCSIGILLVSLIVFLMGQDIVKWLLD